MNEPQKKEDAAACSKRSFCLLCCVCVCATICFVAYLFVSRTEPARRLWLPVVVQTNGDQTILGDTRQLEFWTPSVKTRDYLHKQGDEVVPTEKWEVLSNDDAVLQFGSVLHTNRNVLGYRRVEVWGQGRTSFKPGWWWTVNVLSNYSGGEMGRMYQQYWNSSQAVFIEVIDNRGHGE
jgi:hypothetical protein